MTIRRTIRATVAALRDWAWGPLVARAGIWIGAFLALAQVGRGAFGELAVPAASASAIATPAREPPAPPASAPASATPPKPCPSAAPTEPGVTPDGKVILNTASARDLTRLPGVGEARAEAIVAVRERLGRFRSVRDLLRVKGIGPRSLARLEPLVVLDPPKQEPPKQEPPNER
jgi:competence protein ComEA